MAAGPITSGRIERACPKEGEEGGREGGKEGRGKFQECEDVCLSRKGAERDTVHVHACSCSEREKGKSESEVARRGIGETKEKTAR